MSTEVSYEAFYEWAVGHFGEWNVIQLGEEVCINSPFVLNKVDTDHKLYCNPSKGIYHCWKSGEAGTLPYLVKSEIGCSYPEAMEILGGDQSLRNMHKKLEDFYADKEKIKIKTAAEEEKNLLSLPPDSSLISVMPVSNKFRILAETYLKDRKIPIDGLYVCTNGLWANRVVIPYYGPNGNLIYFNGRDITNKSKLRYRGPPKTWGVGKGEVIWVKQWPEAGRTLYLTEGEFDAMSLWEAEFCGAALGGKNLGPKQFQLLEPYDITICFDLDKYGKEALNKVSAFMRSNSGRPRKIGYVKPAFGFKDWNEMLKTHGKAVLHQYIMKSEKTLDSWGELMKMYFDNL